MTKLTASMVVDLKDNTGPGARSAMRNLRNMKREGDMLARDMERQTLERVRRRDEMMNAALIAGRTTALGVVAAGVVAGKAFTDFAALERRVNRIAINAGQSADKVQPIIERLQTVAKDTRMGFDATVEGLETLIASGRTLDEGLSFLPAVATTAQASGSAIKDVALSADALSGSLNIAAKDMQAAFDILVEGGKQGKFELKDMSQYLPSLLPLFSQIGYEGTKDLKKIVAMLQLVRNKAGTASEANTYLSNVVSKMFSNETNAKFKKFGVNLQKELRKAKDEGRDVMETFLDLTDQVLTKNKIEPAQLFSDMEFQRGVLALMSQREKLKELVALLDKAGGSTMKDFAQATSDAQGAIDRLSASWDKLWTKVGQKVAKGAVPLLDTINTYYDDNDAYGEGVRKTTGGDKAFEEEQEREFAKQYNKRFPDRGPEGYKLDLERMLQQVGRDQAKSVFEFFKRLDLADEYRKAQYQPGKGKQTKAPEEKDEPLLSDKRGLFLDRRGKLPVIPEDRVPTPSVRPRPLTRAEVKAAQDAERSAIDNKSVADAYRYGTGREEIGTSQQRLADEKRKLEQDVTKAGEISQRRQRFEDATRPYDRLPGTEDMFREKPKEPRDGFDMRRWWLGQMSNPGFSLNEALGVQTNADGGLDRKATNEATAAAVADAVAGFFETIRQAAERVVDETRAPLNERATQAGERRQSFERDTAPRFGVDRQENFIRDKTSEAGRPTGTETAALPSGDRSAVASSVTIAGTPTVIAQPTGVQQVSVTNMPQPNITYNVSASVTVNEAADGEKVARDFASSVKTAIAGTHADMNHQAHA